MSTLILGKLPKGWVRCNRCGNCGPRGTPPDAPTPTVNMGVDPIICSACAHAYIQTPTGDGRDMTAEEKQGMRMQDASCDGRARKLHEERANRLWG